MTIHGSRAEMSSPPISQRKSSTSPTPNHPITSSNPVIGFLDIDSFECQLWQRDHPHTRGRPCVVVNTSQRILSVTREAKNLGINRKDTPSLPLAREKLESPRDLIVFWKQDNKWGKQDNFKLRLASSQIIFFIELFIRLKCKRPSEVVIEVASTDEVYIDFSSEVSRELEERYRWSHGKLRIPPTVVWERKTESKRGPFEFRLAHLPKTNDQGMMTNMHSYGYKNEERLMFGAVKLDALCRFLFKHTGLYSSGGVASNKLLAKIGCGMNKPGRVTVMWDWAFARVAENIPIENIPGLGGSFGEKLKDKFQMHSVHELRHLDYDYLELEFGKETAQQISSWGRGLDVTPVLRKIRNDHVTCNKPLGDIVSLKRLREILRNLTEEIGQRLLEERYWHHRTSNKVRVDYTFKNKGEDADTTGSEVMDIEGPKIKKLPDVIYRHLAKLPNFTIDKVKVTTLAFVLFDFHPTTHRAEILWMQPRNFIHDPPAKNLRIFSKKDQLRYANRLRFSHQFIGSFRINSEMEYSLEEAEPPTLLPDIELQSLVGTYLRKSYDENSPQHLILDYNKYDEQKHHCFSKWLFEESGKISGLWEDVEIVSFQGRIVRSLKTPLNSKYGEWETHAVNIAGVIYLWDEKAGRRQSRRRCRSEQYVGNLFEKLVTGQDDVSCEVNELDKVFLVHKVRFGKHRLLLLSNVDAKDEDNDLVQVQLNAEPMYYPTAPSKSYMRELDFKKWAQAEVSGVKKIVTGGRDWNHTITKMDTILVSDLREKLGEKVTECFLFEDRLLEWIKSHLPESNPFLVKKFSWIPGYPAQVVSSTVQPCLLETLLVPKIYFGGNMGVGSEPTEQHQTIKDEQTTCLDP